MKTVTVIIPEDLDQQLIHVAEETGESKSNLIPAAIEYVLSMRDKHGRRGIETSGGTIKGLSLSPKL